MSDSSVQVLRQGFSSHMEEQGEQEGQEENLVIKEEPEEQPEDLSIVHPNDVKILEQQNWGKLSSCWWQVPCQSNSNWQVKFMLLE